MEKKVTKKELAEVLADKYGYTKKEALEVITTLFDEVAKNLENEVSTDISGFGKFVVKTRKERIGINPATKEQIRIPESKAPSFKPAKALKDLFK